MASPSTPRRRTMRDVKCSAKKKIKLDTSSRDSSSPLSKVSILLESRIHEEEEGKREKKCLEELLETLRSTPKHIFNLLLSEDMSEEDVLSIISAKLGHSFLSLLGKMLNHIPSNFPNAVERIRTIVRANMMVNIDDESLDMVIKATRRCANFLRIQREEFLTESLWKATIQTGHPLLKIYMPEVEKCAVCGSQELYPCQESCVTVFTLQGPFPGLKCMLRCKICSTYHHLDGYVPPNEGKAFYMMKTDLIGASNRVFFKRDLHELMCEAGNHAFVSHQAFAEIYNAVFNEKFSMGHHISSWMKDFKGVQESSVPAEDNALNIPLTDDDDVLQPPDPTGVSENQLSLTMTRKSVSSAYFNGELWNELLEKEMTDTFKITTSTTRETVMKELDIMRKQELYPHPDCTDECRKKGCDNLRVIDSCWKVCMCHCMFAVPMEVEGFPLLSFPNVCTNEPQVGSVFCEEHYSLLTRNGVPTGKEDFLKYIGCTARPKSEKDIQTVDQKLTAFAERLYLQDERGRDQAGVSALTYQGTEEIVSNMNAQAFVVDVGDGNKCNKDTGEKARLRQRSRGHFICVTGGGHITYFDPIFKSESPSQVYMQVIRLLYLEFKDIPSSELEDAIKKYVLCYDNMCQLDSLRASKEDLPFPPPMNTMWRDIQKIVDRLHLQNHKRARCKEMYNSDAVLPEGYNTMVAEQTFAWFSRFKKIANSMSQTHHLFYIHRNIKRRNKYTSACRLKGKEPLLPGINSKLAKR